MSKIISNRVSVCKRLLNCGCRKKGKRTTSASLTSNKECRGTMSIQSGEMVEFQIVGILLIIHYNNATHRNYYYDIIHSV